MRTEGSRAPLRRTGEEPLHDRAAHRNSQLAVGETYHVFNRGAHKSLLFQDEADYQRFLLLMFLANTDQPLHMHNLFSKYRGRTLLEIFDLEKVEKNLVGILAYSLMPNHFHMVLEQKADNGIERYIRKVATAYSMYFNLKYAHSGTLIQGRYKSNHIDNEAYYRWIFSYVHLNPVALKEPEWEEKGIRDPKVVRNFLRGYPFSSYFDYCVGGRPERNILSTEETPAFLREQDDLADMLAVFSKVRP